MKIAIYLRAKVDDNSNDNDCEDKTHSYSNLNGWINNIFDEREDCLCAFVNDYYIWFGRVVAAASAAVAAAAIHRIFASAHFNDTTILQNLIWLKSIVERGE